MTRTIAPPDPRLPVVLDTVAAVSRILPEREAGPLQNGVAWAIRHQGDEPPGARDLIASRQVGNTDQAAIFLGAVSLVREQMDRDTDQRIAGSERVVPRTRPGPHPARDRG